MENRTDTESLLAKEKADMIWGKNCERIGRE